MSDWKNLEEPARNSLGYLRGLRDAIAADLLSYDPVADAEKLMEELLTYRYPTSSYRRLKDGLIRREYFLQIEALDLLNAIVRRIARIEREKCGIELSQNSHAELIAA